ncbi:MAG: hypothetical protein GYB67_01155 [Chloroflexi bacterium]|nr:hypothetical protein [Chloroflexota bacterium]
MLRGFRWQIAALLLSASLFLASLLLRSTDPNTPDAPPTPSPTAQSTPITAAPTTAPAVVAVVDSIPPAEPRFDVPTYREALIGQVQRLNPLLADLNPVDRDITALIFEGLVGTNAFGEPTPLLAERWQITADNHEYIVFLRDDVRWHDGTPFTAADVVYTMSLLRSPDFPGPADLYDFWRTVETERLDTHVVRFRLTQPLGTFLDKLRVGILPEHALRGTTADLLIDHPFNLTPIGTGPYQRESLRAGPDGQVEIVDLRAAPVYRQRAGVGDDAFPEDAFSIERVRFHIYDTFDAARQALQTGAVDGLATRDYSQRLPLAGDANRYALDLHTQIEPTLGVIIFNWAAEDVDFFADRRVRVALATGLDLSSLIERNLDNQAVLANSPLMPGSWAYRNDLPHHDYDPEAARRLLESTSQLFTIESEDAAADEAAAAPLFTFSILVPDEPALIALTEEIGAQWDSLNLDVTVEAVDSATYLMRLDQGDFDAALVEYALGGSADPDVYAFWHENAYPDGQNYGGVTDRLISEMLEKARTDPYGVNRIIEYHRFQRDFVERAIALPLYYPLFTVATARHVDGIQLGFIGSPADRFRNIHEWSLTR